MLARSSNSPALRDFLFILVVATIVVSPMLIFGYQLGHDLEIHLDSWLEASAQFRQGILFPRWASQANYGFGDPRFIFYPPASWVLGGILGLILPWKAVPAAFIWLSIVLAAAAMRKLAADWLPPTATLAAALVYAVNPYMLTNAYTRSAFGEILACAVFPFLLWGAFRIQRDPSKGFAIVAVSLAAIWLSNLPAGVIASYVLGLVLLINSAAVRSVRPLLYGSAAALTAFGLAAFTLFPAAWERQWVYIDGVLRPNQLPWANFLFSPHNMAVMPNFNHMLSPLAVVLILSALASAIAAWRMRYSAPGVWWPLAVLCVVSGFLMFPVSKVIWRSLPELRFVQFPWRWLFPICAAGSFLAVFALVQSKRKRILVPVLSFAVFAVDTAIICAKPVQHNLVEDIVAKFNAGRGYRGLVEYTPLPAKGRQLPPDAPLVAPLGAALGAFSASAPISVEVWSPERKIISAALPEPMTISLKLLAYPAWQATMNGKPAALQDDPETGAILLVLPAGPSRTEIKFGQTRDRGIGKEISIGSCFFLIALSPLFAMVRKRATQGREVDVAVPANAP